MSIEHQDLESLLLDWESGALDAAGIQQLRQLLKIDADARARFLQQQLLTAALHLESDAGLAVPTTDEAGLPTARPTAGSAPQSRRWLGLGFWLVSALSLLLCVAAGWQISQWLGHSGNSALTSVPAVDIRPATEEATSQGIALVTRLVDVAWATDQSPLEVGDALAPGRFAIQSGHAQVEFFCGATVVIEGPAELELASPTLARVRSGRLRAQVPPAARGFSLEVDDLTVVDLGTEFGLAVSPQGADIQVFDGEVELQRDADDKRLLTAGQGLVRTAAGNYQDSQVTPERFLDIADLETKARQQRSARYQRWQDWSQQVRRDPRLIAYYAFDQPGDWDRRLPSSIEPANRELDGAIVGAHEVAGRWDSKGALEFKQPADRVRVQIPGQYSSLTLACWVRIDSLDRWFNSLFLTDGYDQGEPHWQILDTGQIYFSVRPVDRRDKGTQDFKALSPSFWKPAMNGRWLHLAVTCDLQSNTITHYTNGQILSRHVVPAEQMPAATQIGAASIGNWAAPTQPDSKFAIRNLNGSIDELAIYAAALTAAEIQEMYEYGKP